MGQSHYLHFEECEIMQVTQKAILAKLANGREVWIPKSCIADKEQTDALDAGDSATLSVKEKFVLENREQFGEIE